MTKLNRRNFTFGAGLGGAASLLAAPAIAQSQKVLRLQSIDPPSFVGPSVALPNFAKAVEEMSGGELRVEVYTAGQVVPTSEIPAALAAGAIDLAYTGQVYYTGIVPENVLSYSALPPALIPQVNDGVQIYNYDGVDDIIAEAWVPEGVKAFKSLFLGDPIAFWSKEPINSVSELGGFKVRSFGYAAKTLEKLGASPVFMPHEEVYTALSQGSIDGSMTAASYYKRANYFEVAPYFYDSGWYEFVQMATLASLNTWEGLSEAQQSILTYAMASLGREMQHLTWLEYRQMLTEFEEMGATHIKWGPEDVAAIREAGASFLPEVREMSPKVNEGIDILQGHVDKFYG